MNEGVSIMLRIILCCGNGMFTSQMMMMNVENVIKKYGVDAVAKHDSVGNAQSSLSQYNLLMCSNAFEPIFKPHLKNTDMITLTNVASKSEVEEKLTAYLKEKGLID